MAKPKLTLKQLIDDKEKLAGKKAKTKDVYVEELDAVVTIETPSRKLIMESMEIGESGADEFLVYNCIVEPNLRDKDLQKTYECAEPVDIVEKVFNIGSVKGIAEQALSMAGFDSKVTAVEELKN